MAGVHEGGDKAPDDVSVGGIGMPGGHTRPSSLGLVEGPAEFVQPALVPRGGPRLSEVLLETRRYDPRPVELLTASC